MLETGKTVLYKKLQKDWLSGRHWAWPECSSGIREQDLRGVPVFRR
jgi:hypothetical protein